MRLRVFRRCEQQSARAVDNARAVARVVHVLNLRVRICALDQLIEGLAGLVERHGHEVLEHRG